MRSSCLSSLQQTPSALECLSHLELSGAGSLVTEFVIGHTGGFVAFVPSSVRRGRATLVDVEFSDIVRYYRTRKTIERKMQENEKDKC